MGRIYSQFKLKIFGIKIAETVKSYIETADTACKRPAWLRIQSSGDLPGVYQPASWRNTTRINLASGRMGVGFNMATGEVIRLSLDKESARHLAESIQEYLEIHRTLSQSPTSEGKPNLEGSPQDNQGYAHCPKCGERVDVSGYISDQSGGSVMATLCGDSQTIPCEACERVFLVRLAGGWEVLH